MNSRQDRLGRWIAYFIILATVLYFGAHILGYIIYRS